jgi:hypothetical protein
MKVRVCGRKLSVSTRRASNFPHHSPPALASLAHAYGVSGTLSQAGKVLASLQQISKRRYVSAFDMAVVFAGIGDSENTFQWLEKAYAGRESQMAFLGVTRRLDPVRSDPSAELLHRMGWNVRAASSEPGL